MNTPVGSLYLTQTTGTKENRVLRVIRPFYRGFTRKHHANMML